MRHEHRQQPVAALGGIGSNRAQAGVRSVNPRSRTGPDLELDRAHGGLAGYGKIERIASRMRPMPPPAGADS